MPMPMPMAVPMVLTGRQTLKVIYITSRLLLGQKERQHQRLDFCCFLVFLQRVGRLAKARACGLGIAGRPWYSGCGERMEPIARIIMVTPFDSSIVSLSADEQLLLLRGCVLCQITRDLDNGSTRIKPEWKSCKEEFGCPIDIYTFDRIDFVIAEAIENQAPAVCAKMQNGRIIRLMAEDELARCRGSVPDFRGRLMYRLAAVGLTIGTPSSSPSRPPRPPT